MIPPPVTKLFRLQTVVVLHDINHIKIVFYIKAHEALIFFKHVAKFQFTMACKHYVVVIYLSEPVSLNELEPEQV